MPVTEKRLIRSGEVSQVSGYYIYSRNANYGVIPCIPTKEEEVIVLEKGDIVPSIASCSNHAALYKLVAKKN